MKSATIPLLGTIVLVALVTGQTMAQNDDSDFIGSLFNPDLQTEVKAALANESNALTQEDLTRKQERLQAERAKLKDYLQSQDEVMAKLDNVAAEAQTQAQIREALIAEKGQLQAELTTNEAKLIQLGEQLTTAETDNEATLGKQIERLRQRQTTLRSRLQAIETKLATMALPPSDETYTVQAGDTLSTIAEQQYGDRSRWKAIFEANRSTITDPDRIRTDMVLELP